MTNQGADTLQLLSAKRAVWHCGKLCNSIAHSTQVAWLCGSTRVRSGSEIEKDLVRLSEFYRGATDSERSRIKFESTVEQVQLELKSLIGTAEHLEAIEALTASLRDDLRSPSDQLDEQILRRRWDFALGPVNDISERLREQITSNLSDPLLEIFVLAEWFDRLTHPHPAYDCMTLDRYHFAPIERPSWDAQPTLREPQVSWIPRMPLLSSVDWPCWAEAKRQLIVRISGLRLPPDAETTLTDEVQKTEVGTSSIEIALIGAICGMRTEIPAPNPVRSTSNSAAAIPTTSGDYPEYLGLFYDEELTQLRMIGSDKFFPIRGQSADFLAHLIGTKGIWQSQLDLMTAWQPNEEKHRREDISSALTKVRDALEHFGFKLDPLKPKKWRIIKLEQ